MPETITYRKSNCDVFWHINPRCPDWPTKNYNEVISEHAPAGGAFCTDCIRMRIVNIERIGDPLIKDHETFRILAFSKRGKSAA